MKLDQDQIGHHFLNEINSNSDARRARSHQGQEEQDSAPKERVYSTRIKIAAAIVFLILFLSLSFFGYKEYKAYVRELNSYYIPQPFTQKYEFRENTLANGLKSLYVKLNQKKEKVYVGNLISIGCRDSK